MFLGIEQHSEIINSTLVNQVSTYGSLIQSFFTSLYLFLLSYNKQYVEIY